MNKPPIAKITGNVVITLPTDTAELDGSKSSDDKGIVSYLWTRDEGSPAAGEVLNHSDHHPILFLSNLVEGTYTFHLHVTDAKGESDMDRTTVEVKPGESVALGLAGSAGLAQQDLHAGPLPPSEDGDRWQSWLLNTLETPS